MTASTPELAAALALLTLAAAGLGAVSAGATRRFVGGPPAMGPRLMILLQIALAGWALAAAPDLTSAWVALALAAALLILAATDISALRLPDAVTLPLLVAGLAEAAWTGSGLAGRLVGALAGWASLAAVSAGFEQLTGRRGLGLGDAKLLAAAGAWCGWRALPAIVLIACLFAFIWAGARAVRQGRISAHAPLPFGPPLALAFWIVHLHGAPGLQSPL